ncbi:MAG: 2-C-methyl-D-erythritol 4-phosphate cytidylyltransferase [Bacteroidales bacterium]|nr:2-C-methyl-D-erythritol 4-phosphate cytidylyltransferase [Bacteroidales bacterium]
MEVYIVIVADSQGLRKENEEPKSFHLIDRKPVVMHTFDAFSMFYGKAKFLLVLPELEIGRWKHLCFEFDFNVPHELVEGGPTRFHSVKNALARVPEKTMVLIHDAVRPLVDEHTIMNCFRTAKIHGNAIPVIPLKDPIRKVEKALSLPVDRTQYRVVQTPQVFQSQLIKKAYMQIYREQFTDDASVLESTGTQMRIVEGNEDNIKITRAGDLGYAQIVLQSRNK